MRRTTLTLVLVLVGLLTSSTAHAAGGVSALLADACGDEQISGSYSPATYAQALRDLDTQFAEYSGCESVLRQGQLAAAGTRSSARAGGGSSSGGSGAASSSAAAAAAAGTGGTGGGSGSSGTTATAGASRGDGRSDAGSSRSDSGSQGGDGATATTTGGEPQQQAAVTPAPPTEADGVGPGAIATPATGAVVEPTAALSSSQSAAVTPGKLAIALSLLGLLALALAARQVRRGRVG